MVAIAVPIAMPTDRLLREDVIMSGTNVANCPVPAAGFELRDPIVMLALQLRDTIAVLALHFRESVGLDWVVETVARRTGEWVRG